MDQETIDKIEKGLNDIFNENYVMPESKLLVLISIFTSVMERAGFSESFFDDTCLVLKRDFLRKRSDRFKDSK